MHVGLHVSLSVGLLNARRRVLLAEPVGSELCHACELLSRLLTSKLTALDHVRTQPHCSPPPAPSSHHRYTLDRPPAEWAYSSGFIDEDMLRHALWPAAADAQVLMCGPPPMLKFACVPNLLKMGYGEEQLISF